MPELPEVEVIKTGLKRKLRNRVIRKVKLSFSGGIKNLSPQAFSRKLTGRRIEDVSRRGKFLIFSLDDGSFLVIHLKMTGQLIYQQAKEEMARHTRIVFQLDGGFQLRFIDLRKFGAIYLVRDLREIPAFLNLGPEPLERNFTAHCLRRILKGRSGKIKPLLLDQNLIAGLGNIYAMEALYRARMSPERRAEGLSSSEVKKLHGAIKDVLREAISARGTSTDTYRNSEGRRGRFQYKLAVYQREGMPCFWCGTRISRVKISGRNTYFCPGCQK